MYNAVEFKRVKHVWDHLAHVGEGSVYIHPRHVVKVEPVKPYAAVEPGVALITPVAGSPEIVEGAPSEVNKRLQRGV